MSPLSSWRYLAVSVMYVCVLLPGRQIKSVIISFQFVPRIQSALNAAPNLFEWYLFSSNLSFILSCVLYSKFLFKTTLYAF